MRFGLGENRGLRLRDRCRLYSVPFLATGRVLPRSRRLRGHELFETRIAAKIVPRRVKLQHSVAEIIWDAL